MLLSGDIYVSSNYSTHSCLDCIDAEYVLGSALTITTAKWSAIQREF